MASSSDPGRKYAYWPNLPNKDLVTCTLCGHSFHGGIKMLKQHLAGGFGDTKICTMTTIAIRKEHTFCEVYRSILKAPEQGTFRRTANKTGLGPPSKSRYTSDNKESAASPPDISTFAYRPMKTAASDQGKNTGKATDTTDGPPDLRTYAYTSMAPTVCCPGQTKYTGTATRFADSPPDLSTFAYKPVKAAVRHLDGSRFRETTLKATRGTSRSRFK